LNFAGAGIEVKIRYPVHLSNAAEIDDRVSQQLIRAIADLSLIRSPHQNQPDGDDAILAGLGLRQAVQ